MTVRGSVVVARAAAAGCVLRRVRRPPAVGAGPEADGRGQRGGRGRPPSGASRRYPSHGAGVALAGLVGRGRAAAPAGTRPGAGTRTGLDSAQTWRSTSRRVSGCWAPGTAYLRSITKKGTAEIPNERARASSPRTSSAYRSPASTARTSSASRPASTATSTRVSARPVGRPSVNVAAISRSLTASCTPRSRPRWRSRWASKVLPGPGQVEADVDAGVVADPGHALDHRLRLGHRDAVLRRQPVDVGALPLDGRGRVELERPPHHLHLVGVLEASEGGLEVALADVAPGTDDVGPDLHSHDPVTTPARAQVRPGCIQTVQRWMARKPSRS